MERRKVNYLFNGYFMYMTVRMLRFAQQEQAYLKLTGGTDGGRTLSLSCDKPIRNTYLISVYYLDITVKSY